MDCVSFQSKDINKLKRKAVWNKVNWVHKMINFLSQSQLGMGYWWFLELQYNIVWCDKAIYYNIKVNIDYKNVYFGTRKI